MWSVRVSCDHQMRRLYQVLTRRMVVKVFLATAFVVGQALVLLAYLQSREEVASLKQATREAAQQIADLVVGSMEHAMLQGDGIAVKKLVEGFKERVPDAEIGIYDRHGAQVFGDKPAAPDPKSLPAPFVEVGQYGARLVAEGRVWRPIPNEERCHDCHDADAMLRGVLVFERDEAVLRVRREALAAELIRAGFEQVMASRQAARLDDYFAELSARAPTIPTVAVYDNEGDLAFGKDVAELPREAILAALVPGAAPTRIVMKGAAVQLVPLPREQRCAPCHKDKNPVRGVLAVALLDVTGDDRAALQEVEVIVDSSLRAIMMSSLGRIAADFLSTVTASGAVKSLVLYDPEGRPWYTSAPPPPEASVQAALAAPTIPPMIVGAGAQERIMMARRLDNGERCSTCHGTDDAIRGVVTVSLSNSKALMVRENAITRTAILSVLALALMLLLVYGLLKVFVERPVAEIDAACAAVGTGDLTVRVMSADPAGDELRRLGARINDMIQGLRAKFVLEKFVSKGAAQAARSGAERNSKLDVRSAGERRHLTVLFSDIRGFTAFAETVAPEAVVSMLNAFLQAQAEVVEKWHGDIDKFVGDELMAVFHGPDAARNAVRCAVELLEAVEHLRKDGHENLGVGVGVCTGDVVYGPIGSQKRMDFTVIGDVVNTGARLCSAAAGGQVIVARATLDDCRGGLGDVEFNPLAPIRVKNKREPLEIYSATRVSGGA